MVEKKKLDQAAVNEAMGILLDPPGSDTARAKKTLKNATEEQKEKAREDLKDYDPSEKMAKGGKVGKGYHKMPDGKTMKDSAHKKNMAHGGKVGRGCGAAMKGGGSVMKYGKSGC